MLRSLPGEYAAEYRQHDGFLDLHELQRHADGGWRPCPRTTNIPLYIRRQHWFGFPAPPPLSRSPSRSAPIAGQLTKVFEYDATTTSWKSYDVSLPRLGRIPCSNCDPGYRLLDCYVNSNCNAHDYELGSSRGDAIGPKRSPGVGSSCPMLRPYGTRTRENPGYAQVKTLLPTAILIASISPAVTVSVAPGRLRLRRTPSMAR